MKQEFEQTLKQTLAQLKDIEKRALDLNHQMNEEQRVLNAEIRDAKRLGLTTGEARWKHYNEWMKRNGMEYLMVK